MKFLKPISFVLIILLFASCEKDVDFQLQDVEPRLVVDAQIENGQYPFAVLTKSMDYFSQISPQQLAALFVHGADITISNGTLTHRLKEYSIQLAPGITGYFYTIDSANMATAFKGERLKNYTLKIISEGKEYASSVSIPGYTAKLDSMWVRQAPDNPDPKKRVVYIRSTDPPGRGDYMRYFTKINSQPFYAPPNSVWDDQVVDGKTFNVTLQLGYDKNNPIKADSNFAKKGDTITIRFCNIDKSVYTFWSTWEFSQQAIGNPFSQPNKVISNISNGALGVFSGYGATYKTIIAD